MITAKDLAAKLNGREYREEITKEECDLAAKSGLVVIFGASDDLCELRGAIDDEVGCWGGGEAFFAKNLSGKWGLLHANVATKSTPTVATEWRGGKWTYRVPWPHETFRIMEDGELYCIGAVFHVDSIPSPKA